MEEKLQKKYDELDNIISTLDILIGEITDQDYKDTLCEIKYDAQEELDRVQEQLEKLEEDEYKSNEVDWNNSRL